MLINILLGFVFPWIFGIWLYLQSPKIVLTIGPFASVLSYIVNVWGIYNHYWILTPVLEVKTASVLPMNLGIFPVIACFTYYLILRTRIHPYFWILFFSVAQTILESIAYYFGKVQYFNGWNIGGTFLSYLIPAIITYMYFVLLKAKGVLEKHDPDFK
ncbi:hypothetical protein HP567_011480 [Brevibacillus sp. M2.1A]|uniref:hypothetical protein n=1 Tax=Brevibacillus TaxID=55080 RepID=UPI00156AC9A3|nr:MULTISPECIES: hypothetical protein [Brevibacillus]MBY0085911.1 hypothetical protein [Brevibacillus brevis]MCC8435165.1 hypothetical protein [Brevibacillus sp. M2.1A]MCE0452265.1 hypothetical protein [Brevibacillus sp. AF8]UKK97548.1 hypothetical protein FO446_09010 [Brevibacillus brevis]